MDENLRNRRRNYFIDKQFQTKFILKFCSLIILASALAGIFIYYFNRQTTTVAFENLRVVVKTTSDFILPAMLQILVIVSFFIGLATVGVTLFASHKIAGPLYKLMMELDRIKEGDLSSPIRIRADDQLQNAAAKCEALRLELADTLGALKDNWGVFKGSMEKLLAHSGDGEEIRSIKHLAGKIDSALSKFKPK